MNTSTVNKRHQRCEGYSTSYECGQRVELETRPSSRGRAQDSAAVENSENDPSTGAVNRQREVSTKKVLGDTQLSKQSRIRINNYRKKQNSASTESRTVEAVSKQEVTKPQEEIEKAQQINRARKAAWARRQQQEAIMRRRNYEIEQERRLLEARQAAQKQALMIQVQREINFVMWAQTPEMQAKMSTEQMVYFLGLVDKYPRHVTVEGLRSLYNQCEARYLSIIGEIEGYYREDFYENEISKLAELKAAITERVEFFSSGTSTG